MQNRSVQFQILELVEQVYGQFSLAAAQKGLRYTYSVSHKIPSKLSGDIAAIKKAFAVLVDIAVEESTGGAVELDVDLVAQTNDSVHVRFSINQSTMKNPHWFSVQLQKANKEKVASPKKRHSA